MKDTSDENFKPKRDKTDAENVHSGHRQRLKRQLLEHGLDSINDIGTLELLLYSTNRRKDTNPVAHALLREFVTLSGVFDASLEALKAIDGVGEESAILLKLVPQLGRRYLISRAEENAVIASSDDAGKYFLPYFFAETSEKVLIACLDAKQKVVVCRKIGEGTINAALINIRKIVETAVAYNSSSIVIAHNHTSGIALPSQEDVFSTKKIKEALAAIDIPLVDHIIVADDDYVSMKDSGCL
ncbi:MAG: DNA repair protein RadC [Oscillospiraceae bacterium]|nr:DNA repair protein RadC [Oscillospiraceae bacterium]